MVMRRQPGIDLFQYTELYKGHWLLNLLIVRCALQACEVQLFAHRRIHLDIKPPN